MSVTISSSVKNNLLALQSISSQASASQNILSTGKKVNSALDNATSFFTASSLTSRANSLTGLLDSVSNGIQTIQAANTGITSITKLVDQLKSTGQQALSTASAYTSQASFSTTAISGATSADLRGTPTGAAAATVTGTAAITTLSSGAGNLVLNGQTVAIAGTETLAQVKTAINAVTAQSGVTASDDGSGHLKLTQGDTTTSLVIGSGSTAATLTALGLTSGSTAATPATGPLNGKTLTFTVGSGSPLAIKFGDPATTSGTVKSLDDLNSKLSSIGLTASVDATGVLKFGTTSDTASSTFSVKSDTAVAGVTTSDVTSSSPVRGGAGADSRDALVTQYNGVLDQINTLAKDSSFNGLNLLTGDTLSLTFNEKNTSKLSITGQDASFTGLGLSKVTASNFNDGNGVNAVLTALEGSKTTLSTLSSKLGANLAVVQTRQDFTKNLANTLSTGSDNLVNADLNEEATKLLALQTSQSLAQSALSLANQSNQGVLRLLQ